MNDRPIPMSHGWSPDAQIALGRRLMERAIGPALLPGQGALLLLFPIGRDGTTCCLATTPPEEMRPLLAELLQKWSEGEGINGP